MNNLGQAFVAGLMAVQAFFGVSHETELGAGTYFLVQQGGTGAQSFTSSQLLYGAGTNAIKSVATTTASCAGSASCTDFTIIGSSPITITASGGTASGNVSTSTNETKGQLPYWTTTSGTPATLGAVATGTITYPTGLTGTAGRYVIGGGLTIALDTGYVIPLQSTLDGKVDETLTLTVAGTANQITSSAGAQDLSTNRTWTLSLPSHVIFPSSYVAALGSTTNATSTNLTVTGKTILSNLTSALVLAGSDASLSEYTGIDCTNQFVRDVSAAGAGTCATVGAADVSLANLTATDSTLTFSGTYTGATARTIGLNLGNANIWTAQQTFNANASTTQVSATKAFFGGTATSSIGVNGYYGFGTTSPFSAFTLDRTAGVTPAATSSITVTEYRPATSTAGTLDARDSNSILWQTGAAATTLTLTGFTQGKQLRVTVCNPSGGAAGAITWATSPANLLLWAGGSVPSQTTTANKCDVYSFVATSATSSQTSAAPTNFKILGAQSANF